MARFAVPGLPHHVTQRGNRRENVFFGDDDYELYRNLLGQQARKQGVSVWNYCLMPTPSTPWPPKQTATRDRESAGRAGEEGELSKVSPYLGPAWSRTS
jgi:putative transposase